MNAEHVIETLYEVGKKVPESSDVIDKCVELTKKFDEDQENSELFEELNSAMLELVDDIDRNTVGGLITEYVENLRLEMEDTIKEGDAYNFEELEAYFDG